MVLCRKDEWPVEGITVLFGAIVGLFVLLKGAKVRLNQFFFVWCWCKVFTVWAKNM